MPEITLKEMQAVQQMETDHRKAIKMLGTLHNYLNFVLVHPSYSDNPEAQAVAQRALELMEAEIKDMVN